MSYGSTISDSHVVMSVCHVDRQRLSLRALWQGLTNGSVSELLRQKERDAATRTHVLV